MMNKHKFLEKVGAALAVLPFIRLSEPESTGWVHIGVTWDTEGVKLYVDDKPIFDTGRQPAPSVGVADEATVD
jgi:hypothetical protein